MITLELLCAQIAGLQADDVRRWVENAWVRPLPSMETEIWYFEDIDVARVRLIVELRDDMRIDEEALPVVLSLLDQIHDLRRQLVTLQAAISEAVAPDVRDSIIEVLRRVEGGR